MVEKRLLVKTTNKVEREIYYLGHFAMQALHRDKVPHKDSRQAKYLDSIAIRTENGPRFRNNRHNVTRTSSSNKRQEPSAPKKRDVTPSAKKSKLNPKLPLFTSDEESSNNPTEVPSKDKDGALNSVKSTSDNESKDSDDSSSSDEESEKSNHSSPKSATKLISIRDIMNGMLADTRSV
jgi:hypothetical protein